MVCPTIINESLYAHSLVKKQVIDLPRSEGWLQGPKRILILTVSLYFGYHGRRDRGELLKNLHPFLLLLGIIG